MDKDNYCPYCMSPVEPATPCPSCGLTAGAYAPSPHHLPPGTVLRDRYLIGRVLGEGGFGITYIGCDLRLELKVAIKEYFPTDRANRVSAASLEVSSYSGAAGKRYETGKARFLQEARTMAKMDKQPVIVSVRDFFDLNNTAYIVMEYVEGTTFKDLVDQRGGRIPAGELLHVIEPLFSALNAMHKQGLIHRDISPENLMLENGDVRLLDFGCARESAGGEATMTIALKHGYAPVEQYQDKGQGPWTDVYALSATIYYCLTGRKPPQSMDRLVEDELILPRKLGVDLTLRQEKALVYGMGVRPRKRFQSIEELHAALYEGVLPEGWNVPPEPPPAPEWGEPEPIGTTGPATAAGQVPATAAGQVPVTAAGQMPATEPRGASQAPAETQARAQTLTQTQTQTQLQPGPAPTPDWQEKLKAHWQIAAGAGTAAILLAVLLAWHPWTGAQPSVDDPLPSVSQPAAPDASREPAQTNPSDVGYNMIATSESGLLNYLNSQSVGFVSIPSDCWFDVSVPITLTKTLRIEKNAGISFSGGLTVAREGKVEVAGSLDASALLRTVDGGAVSVEDSGQLSSPMIWLAREGDLTCTENGIVDVWGGNDPTKGPINDYSRSHYWVFDEEDLFAGAVHVTTEEEFARNCQGSAPIVIDRDLTLTNQYWPTVSIRVPKGITLNAPCPDPGSDDGNCTLEMRNGAILVNHGTVTGRVSFDGVRRGENGQWLGEIPYMLANFGTVDANLWGEMGAVVNLGTMNVRESLRNTALHNLGTLTLDGQMEVMGNWWQLAGTTTIAGGGDLVVYGSTGINLSGQTVIEAGGHMRSYAQINLNTGSLKVKNGGGLDNRGSLRAAYPAVFQAEDGAELQNSGAVLHSGARSLGIDLFEGPGRLIYLDDNGVRTRHVLSESELRSALTDDSCDLVIWDGYGPDRKIDLNDGPLAVTKGLILNGSIGTPVDFNTGGLTLSGENAFFLGDNVDFHGGELTVEGGAVVLNGDTRNLGYVTVDGGFLSSISGSMRMLDGIHIVLHNGVLVNSSDLEINKAVVDIDRSSTLYNYGGLTFNGCGVTNDGRMESNFGNLYQQQGYLHNNGELLLIGWEEMVNLGNVTNHGQIYIGGQQRVSGTLVNEADGTITLEWEDNILRVSGRLDNRGTIRGARGAYIETMDGGSFTGNSVVHGE